jgi:hypothetical protein
MFKKPGNFCPFSGPVAIKAVSGVRNIRLKLFTCKAASAVLLSYYQINPISKKKAQKLNIQLQ